jgi:hypothetical protein
MNRTDDTSSSVVSVSVAAETYSPLHCLAMATSICSAILIFSHHVTTRYRAIDVAAHECLLTISNSSVITFTFTTLCIMTATPAQHSCTMADSASPAWRMAVLWVLYILTVGALHKLCPQLHPRKATRQTLHSIKQYKVAYTKLNTVFFFFFTVSYKSSHISH